MKRLVDPLVAEGHKVFVSYDSSAFETVKVSTSKGFSYTRSRSPTAGFQAWLQDTAGPLGILWTTTKDEEGKGLFIFFYKSSHAMLCKLTWGGS